MQGTVEDVAVGRTPRKGIPEHGAHARIAVLVTPLVRGHPENRPPPQSAFLDLMREPEHELAYGIVDGNASVGGPVMRLEVPLAHALEHGGCGCRLGRPIGRADAVLVEPGDATVADHHEPVAEGTRCGSHANHWGAVAVDFRQRPIRGQASPDLTACHECLYHSLVDPLAKHAHRQVIAFGDQRGEFHIRHVQQEDVHGAADALPHHVLTQRELADVGPCRFRPLESHSQTFEQLQPARVDPHCAHQQVVGLRGMRTGFQYRTSVHQGDILDPLRHQVGASFDGQTLQVPVKAAPLAFLDPPGTRAAVDRRDPLLVQRCLDPYAAQIDVQHIRIDPSLDDGLGQCDSLGGQDLHQRFRDDAAAMVTACGARPDIVARLVQIHGQFQAHPLGQIQEEVAEEGSGGAAADDGDSRPILQPEAGLVVLDNAVQPINLGVLHRTHPEKPV